MKQTVEMTAIDGTAIKVSVPVMILAYADYVRECETLGLDYVSYDDWKTEYYFRQIAKVIQ